MCAIAGIVTGLRSLKTRRGDRMAVFMLEDESAKVEAVVFPEAFGRFGGLAVDDAMVLVRGKYERDEDSSRFQSADILPLSALRERLSRGVRIRLKGTCPRETIEALWELMTRHRGDRPVAVEVEMSRGPRDADPASWGGNGGARHVIVRAEVTPSIRVRTSEQFVADVEQLCGPGSVTIHS